MPFNLMKEVPQIMCVLDYIATITKTIFLCLIKINPTYWLSLVYVLYCDICYGLPWWLRGRRSAYECRRHRRHGFDPWFGKIPWRRKWQRFPVFLLGKSHGQRNLAGCSLHGVAKSQTWLSMHTHTHTCYLLEITKQCTVQSFWEDMGSTSRTQSLTKSVGRRVVLTVW